MITVINFGTNTISGRSNKNYLEMQNSHTEHLKKWGIQKVISYTPDNFTVDFIKDYTDIMKFPKGFGYWIWKPWIIKNTLELFSEDIVVYMDIDWYFISNPFEFVSAFDLTNSPIAFDMPGGLEREWSKGDAFELMGCNSKKYTETSQRTAGFSLWRYSNKSINFLNDWLYYGKDLRIISDQPSVVTPNLTGFCENRHDQTIYSLLTKKYDIEVFRDPSQYGNQYFERFSNSPYNQVVQVNHW